MMTLRDLFKDGRYTRKMRRYPVRRVRVRAELEGRRIFSLGYVKDNTIKVAFIHADGHISSSDECANRPEDTPSKSTTPAPASGKRASHRKTNKNAPPLLPTATGQHG